MKIYVLHLKNEAVLECPDCGADVRMRPFHQHNDPGEGFLGYCEECKHIVRMEWVAACEADEELVEMLIRDGYLPKEALA